jgi:hypothetical protein
MSHWKINPSGVHGILVNVSGQAEELGQALTEEAFQGMLDGLTWGGPVTVDVPNAVNAVLGDQNVNLQNIGNRIKAGILGVSNAVIAYNNGQQEMAGTYQTELVKSAESGDFTYFVNHGYKA